MSTGEARFDPALRPNLPPDGDDPLPHPPPTPHPPTTPPTPIPPFQAAAYRFTLQSMQINETRSPHQDSDKVGFAVALGSQAPAILTKDLGNVNNGTSPIGLSIGPIEISDPHIGLAMNYAIVNSGGARSWNDVNASLIKTVGPMCSSGAQAATSSVAAVGAVISGFALPIIGSILVGFSSLLIGDLTTILTSACDGPVAAEQAAFKGSDLWANTVHGPYSRTTAHPGVDSAWGCGDNSYYLVTWTITRA